MGRVLLAGTFDILHPGHLHLISEAAKLGEVVVIVARDTNVTRFKGVPPVIPEDQRLEMVRGLSGVSEAVLGSDGPTATFFTRVLELRPDIIMLGPNQGVEIDRLTQGLALRGHPEIQVIRLPAIYSKFELNSSTKIKERIVQVWRPSSTD
jgi:FAD synthetase